ncbi:proteasome regulatory particle lid subunit RPN7 KNAG_0A07580 [Huiozyma naganishii CBS 8797]|uniref:PCI domain-containing protein n=1 Tax=Huiozyma naganishii (strain ATCC MYA-139 / BCRC 22969 / CBS 8797 / KCTC 17520 / NBRC 10181 / NCYC 3082 / Yp74L-3) TaxID=1071383 RepID=J7S466_HUIN7|nr:hypothetical protein KNAG_0A07580 [Kazachstania naganishii CBS 8797]CCK68411.1 hypothetical protein KNAG_0A07580 [Kazachstania naganishii CBS 8797]
MASDNEDEIVQEPVVQMVPNYEVSDRAFLLSLPSIGEQEKQEARQFILETIEKEEMAPYYKHLAGELDQLPYDDALYQRLKATNDQKIKELRDKITELESNDEGALELANGWAELGAYYTQIADLKTHTRCSWGRALKCAISLGAKIDVLFMVVRLGFFYDKQHFVKEKLEEIEALIEKGGDWERRNRYKTYLGVHSLAVRDFKKTAELLVDSLATFTSVELTSYENIATYANVAGLFALERTDLKRKVIDSPEMLSIMTSTPALQSISSLTIALYTSDYASFFPFLLETYDKVLIPCKYLNKHSDFFIREMRRKVYAQLLESYKTLSLKYMATAFGVSVEFLDNDLGKFIPNKKLNCVIDRVNGIVETNRPDNKNAQYQLLVKQGDGLLTKLQKYSTAVKLTGSDRV